MWPRLIVKGAGSRRCFSSASSSLPRNASRLEAASSALVCSESRKKSRPQHVGEMMSVRRTVATCAVRCLTIFIIPNVEAWREALNATASISEIKIGNVDRIVELWFAAWRPVGETERRRLLEICWSRDGVYQDPINDASGREAVMGLITGFHERRPGARIDLASGIDHHHGKLHYQCKMFGADGQMLLEGRRARHGRTPSLHNWLLGSPPPLGTAKA